MENLKMNIEVIEFYPIERNEEKGLLNGTLRIRLPVLGIHIMGIYVSKKNDYWFFSLPGRNGIHHESGESVRYPFIAFENRDQQNELIAAIKKMAPAFIEKRLADTENPLNFPKQQQQTKRMEQPKDCDKEAKVKQKVPIEKSKQTNSITMKEWIDPPPRKVPARGMAFRK